MAIYARQVNPEYQESPLYFFGEFPEGIILDGNKNFKSHTIPEYRKILCDFEFMACGLDNGGYATLEELLHDYGFSRHDGKPWTKKQKHEWKKLMESDYCIEDERIILPALRLLTGKKWAAMTIHGCKQSDWNSGYYAIDEWKNGLEQFEIEYFNTGSEWIIHYKDTEPETPEEINGLIIYCYGRNTDQIRKEIADETGEEPENVVLYEFDGYTTKAKYKKVF